MTDLLLRTVRRVGTSGAPCDVRVVGGRVTAIAPAGTLDAGTAGADTDVVEAAGAWLGPGLVDHHVHLDQWALGRRRVDAAPEPARGLAHVRRRAAARVRGRHLGGARLHRRLGR